MLALVSTTPSRALAKMLRSSPKRLHHWHVLSRPDRHIEPSGRMITLARRRSASRWFRSLPRATSQRSMVLLDSCARGILARRKDGPVLDAATGISTAAMQRAPRASRPARAPPSSCCTRRIKDVRATQNGRGKRFMARLDSLPNQLGPACGLMIRSRAREGDRTARCSSHRVCAMGKRSAPGRPSAAFDLWKFAFRPRDCRARNDGLREI